MGMSFGLHDSSDTSGKKDPLCPCSGHPETDWSLPVGSSSIQSPLRAIDVGLCWPRARPVTLGRSLSLAGP